MAVVAIGSSRSSSSSSSGSSVVLEVIAVVASSSSSSISNSISNCGYFKPPLQTLQTTLANLQNISVKA